MKQTAEKLIQVKYKEAPFGTIGVRCVLSLVCIAILIRNGILRDGSDNIAQIAYIFCLVFLTVLSGYMSIKKQTAGVMRFFMLFLINLYIAVFFSALLNSVYGIPQYAHQLAVFSTLSLFFTVLCFLTLWLYLKQFFEESAMISQMQPHFLYNSLAVIAALCEEDPTLAAKATNAFADYLRENISFANTFVKLTADERTAYEALGIGSKE